jgi:hypothetical protein
VLMGEVGCERLGDIAFDTIPPSMMWEPDGSLSWLRGDLRECGLVPFSGIKFGGTPLAVAEVFM